MSINIPGFTLIELLIVVAIVSILAAVGTPMVANIIRDSRLTSNVNDLIGDLNVARIEAIKRGANVALCPGSTSGGCNNNTEAWLGGRILFVDLDGGGDWDAGETVLRSREASAGSPTVTVSWWRTKPSSPNEDEEVAANAPKIITYRSSGEVKDSTSDFKYYKFKFCESGLAKGKDLRIGRFGQVSTLKALPSCP